MKLIFTIRTEKITKIWKANIATSKKKPKYNIRSKYDISKMTQ